MKFGNFEKLRKNAKNLTKAVMFTAAGLGAGSAMGQASEVSTQTGRFLDRLKEVGIVDAKVSKEEFAKIPEAEMKALAQKYKEVTGAVSPDELPKGKDYITISRTAYGIDEKEEIQQVKAQKEVVSYAEWYAKQKDGDTVLWPVEEGGTGLEYKIDRDSKNKSLYTNAPKVKPMQTEEDESMASTSSSMENFNLLKDRKFK